MRNAAATDSRSISGFSRLNASQIEKKNMYLTIYSKRTTPWAIKQGIDYEYELGQMMMARGAESTELIEYGGKRGSVG